MDNNTETGLASGRAESAGEKRSERQDVGVSGSSQATAQEGTCGMCGLRLLGDESCQPLCGNRFIATGAW